MRIRVLFLRKRAVYFIVDEVDLSKAFLTRFFRCFLGATINDFLSYGALMCFVLKAENGMARRVFKSSTSVKPTDQNSDSE